MNNYISQNFVIFSWVTCIVTFLTIFNFSPVSANSLNFNQSLGSISHLEIRQSESGNSHVHGIDANNNLASDTAMEISGPFNNFIINTQNASGETQVGAAISVTQSSDFDLVLTGDGDHLVSLDITASALSSDVLLDGVGAKVLSSVIKSDARNVVHNIQLYGGPMTLGVQQSGIAVHVNLLSLGTGSTTNIVQALGSSLNVTGQLDSGANFELNQTATFADYAVEVNLEASSSLTINQWTDNLIQSDTGVFKIHVGRNSTMTVTR
jgi:hypothetical protein